MAWMTSSRSSFSAEEATKVARRFHYIAGLLERIHLEEVEQVSKDRRGVTFDWLERSAAKTVSAIVLEGFAVELALKAQLRRAGRPLPKSHDHSLLFGNLPQKEQDEAEARYQAKRHPAMRPTLREALAYSADVFDKWRYM